MIALFCAGLLCVAFILQYAVSFVPCSLCIVQRFFYFLIGLGALSASLGWLKGVSTRMYGAGIVLLSFLGGMVAGRQLWLEQNTLPGDPTKCIIPLGSFFDSVILSLGGTGNCGTQNFVLLGLSLATWSFVCFVLLFLVGIFLVLRLRLRMV